MLLKESWISIADNTNVRWLQIFHLYKGFRRKQTKVGMFIKGAAKVVEPPRLEYKGFKVRFNLKGDVCRGFIIRARYSQRRLDGGRNYFKTNDVILIRKKQDPKSKYLFGPVSKLLFRKRFLALFPSLI